MHHTVMHDAGTAAVLVRVKARLQSVESHLDTANSAAFQPVPMVPAADTVLRDHFRADDWPCHVRRPQVKLLHSAAAHRSRVPCCPFGRQSAIERTPLDFPKWAYSFVTTRPHKLCRS